MLSPWSWSDSRDWDLAINSNVPLELSVDTRFSENQLDLSELMAKDLKLRTNMSTTEVTLPERTRYTYVKISDTMSEIKPHIPVGVSARIYVTGAWEDVLVNEDRFPCNGDIYQSPDYDSSENKIEIDANSNMGILKIK